MIYIYKLLVFACFRAIFAIINLSVGKNKSTPPKWQKIMAIIQSALLSKGRGSAGSVTFRRLNGKTVVSEKPITVKNPDSFQQRRARMFFMLGANAGWALSPYFQARDKMSGVRRATGISKRGSKLLPIQEFVKRTVNLVKNDSRVFTQISAYAHSVPSNQIDYALKTAVVDGNTSPIFQALAQLDVTGLPKENSGVSLGEISIDEGAVQAPITIVEGAGIAVVNVKVYLILVSVSEGAVNRYLVSRNLDNEFVQSGLNAVSVPVTIPTGQSVHQVIVEVVPVDAAAQTEIYSLAVGSNVLLNE